MPVRDGQTPARRLHLPESERSGAPDAPQFHRGRRGDEALISLEFKIPNSAFEMGEPKSSCKSLEQAEYQEKGPRGPQAGNQTGNRSQLFSANMKLPESSPNGSSPDDSASSQPGPPPHEEAVAEIYNNGSWHLLKPAGPLPDLARCRARRKKAHGLVYCLVFNAYSCQFITHVNCDFFCCHPQREEIVARTKAAPGGNWWGTWMPPGNLS